MARIESLRDIPREKIRELAVFARRLVREGRKPAEIAMEIRRRYGLEVSEKVARRLAGWRETIRLSPETVQYLARLYGSAETGIRVIARSLSMLEKLPDTLRRIVEKYGGGEYTWEEIQVIARETGVTATELLRELSRHGLLRRRGDRYVILYYPMDPILEYMTGMIVNAQF